MSVQYEKRRLYRLKELEDYKVADEDVDVRGWDVYDMDKEKFGTIRDLIVDPEVEKVRYLDVIATSDLSVRGGERHLLIPVGVARIDGEEDKVFISEIDKDLLKKYPDYKGAAVTRDYEHTIVETLRGQRPSDVSEEEFYNHELYSDKDFYGARKDFSLIHSDRYSTAYRSAPPEK